jgi:5,10-methylenetetrahydromethanopterin reductase
MPIFMAARGDKALALAGEIADGLMISNACPPAFTAEAVAAMRAARPRAAHPAAVIQYVACASRADRAEARKLAAREVAHMVASFWSLAQRVPATKAALLKADELTEQDFEAATARLRQGDAAETVIDDRFLRAFALFGKPEECLEQAQAYGAAGATELGLTILGDQPKADIAALGASMKG